MRKSAVCLPKTQLYVDKHYIIKIIFLPMLCENDETKHTSEKNKNKIIKFYKKNDLITSILYKDMRNTKKHY